MSAPAVERPRTARPAARQPIARRSTGAPAPRDAGGAIGRAYARRAVRERRQSGEANAAAAGRSQFVLLIMVLFGVGLVASLWLSTTAAADSYRLDAARQATRDLSERSESLRTEIATMQSAPTLAQAAQQMGMVQVSDVARLVVAPDGSVAVVGTPKAAVAPYVPPPVLAPAPPVPGQPVDPAQAAAQGQPVDPAQAAAQGQPVDQGQQTEQPADAAGADGQVTPGQPGVPAVQGPAAESGQQLAVTQQSAGTQQSSGTQQTAARPTSGSQQSAATRQTPQQFAAAAQAQQQTAQQQGAQPRAAQQQAGVQSQRIAGAPTQPATGPGH